MNDDRYLEMIKRDFSGLSTKQLLSREGARFKQELKKNYMVHGFPGLGFSSIVERHNKYCSIIKDAHIYSIDNLCKAERELYFEAIKAHLRVTILEKKITPEHAYNFLQHIHARLNQFSTNEINCLNIPLNRLQFSVSKLSTDLPRTMFDECLLDVKSHIKHIEELRDKQND